MPDATAITRELRSKLRGSIYGEEDAGFEQQRRVWNGAIDRRPCAIARCADARDVQIALGIALTHGVRVTVRGGGHNVAGMSIEDGALLLDLGDMRAVSVNETLRIAVVEGGALWRDVDAATAAVGLATTGGLISTTGVGGFTLGGGAGWLMRRFGLACDNVIGAHVVLADGRSVHVSADEHADLFWALRGGCGGLGVVTHFEFRLHPLSDVLAGLVVFPGDQCRTLLRQFRDLADGAPDEFCALMAMASAPPLPFIDSAWHGRTVCIFAVCWTGDASAGERALEPLRSIATPLADLVATMPYARWQQMLDGGAPAGRLQYWKSANLSSLGDDAIDMLVAASDARPTPFTEVHVQHLGGAVGRVPSSESAFAHRDTKFFVNLMGSAVERDSFDPMRAWVRQLHSQLARLALPGRMPNFADGDDQDAIGRFGADHTRRLRAVTGRYDPQGLFAIDRQPVAESPDDT